MEVIAWLVLLAVYLFVFCPVLALVVSFGESLKSGYLFHIAAGLLLSIIISIAIVVLLGVGLTLKWAIATVGL